MSKCVRCNVEILDDAVKCPLCHGVLKQDDNTVELYPDIEPAIKKMRMVKRITIFAAIVAQSICVLVNYLTYDRFKWSLVTAVALFYACFTLLYSVDRNKSHQRKMIVQLILGILMIVAIDGSLGYIGWSLKYAVPIAIVLMDIGIEVLILVNRSYWQNYIMAQVWMVLVSVISTIVIAKFIDTFPLYSVIALVVSVFCLAISFVLGDKTAENEFRRRFHI